MALPFRDAVPMSAINILIAEQAHHIIPNLREKIQAVQAEFKKNGISLGDYFKTL